MTKFAMIMEFIDTHTHITDEAFLGEEEGFIERAAVAGVSKMVLADIDSSEREAMYAAAGRHPGVLFPMLGLYPGSVDDNWRDELDKVFACKDRHPVAIGEIGLDYHETDAFRQQQKEVFRLQLEFAAEMDLPVNIHLRDATEDFFSVLDDCRHLALRGNMHAFSGSWETFLRLQRYGDWYVGIGGVVTFRNSNLPQAVSKIPLDRILLETDAPYLTPAPYRGRRNESSMIPLIAGAVASVKDVDIEEVAAVTTASARKLFAI